MEKTIKIAIHLKTGEVFETDWDKDGQFSADTFTAESMLSFPVTLYPLGKPTKVNIFVSGSNIAYIEVPQNGN